MAAPIGGIYAMQYAFFNADGSLDRGAMRRQIEACLAARVHGIAVLGLGTEVNKLDTVERRQVLDWVAEDLAGRLPLAVTVAEPSVAGQVAFVRAAAGNGAAWAILQPPPVRAASEAALVAFFGAVADAAPLPIGIQNAPDYIGIGLSDAGLAELARRHPNFRLLKGEGPAVTIRRTIEAVGDRLAVFNGRGGLELTDNLRAGCAGMIPAPECADLQARIFELMASGRPADAAEAERIYAAILPLIVFVMQSIDHFLCYGKRALARRLGIATVHDRAPAVQPSAFGLGVLDRLLAALPAL